jgi:hypothetical protein
VWGDQGVSHESRDVEQGVSDDQRTDTFPAEIDQAEDYAHDQIADEAADALVEVVRAADDRADGDDRDPRSSRVAAIG